jgi:hypothetical protein
MEQSARRRRRSLLVDRVPRQLYVDSEQIAATVSILVADRASLALLEVEWQAALHTPVRVTLAARHRQSSRRTRVVLVRRRFNRVEV